MSMPETLLAFPQSIVCYEAVCARIRAAFPGAAIKVSRTQTAFVRDVQFAWLSAPRRKADHGCVMLSFSLPEPVTSPRIFNRSQPYPGRFMHHMLISGPEALDAECLGWLSRAWAFAQRKSY